jgi:alanyl-tRNA synthetase
MATINHSGIHVVLMELEKLRPNSSSKIYGAKISEKSARLDFITEEKFSKEELSIIEQKVNTLIEAERDMRVYPHPTEKEALFWECDGYSIPCGGTHLTNTKYLGDVKLKRKNIGKNYDRIIAQFENCEIPKYKKISNL